MILGFGLHGSEHNFLRKAYAEEESVDTILLTADSNRLRLKNIEEA